MRKKKIPTSRKAEPPVFDLHAFSSKAAWSDFYIQDLQSHVRDHEFVGRPHKHDFYLIMFTSRGKGAHIIDFVEYRVEPNSVFLMTPGQVHTWTLSPDIDGFIVFFTREFYQVQLSRNSLLEFPFYHSLSASPLIRPPKTDVFRFVLDRMYDEYRKADAPDLRILRAYLDVFLLETARYYDARKGIQVKATTHGNTFKLRRLEQLIDKNFKTLRQAGDYGELMSLAPAYLNSICKNTLGKTLTDLIQERILLEAKRMFAYSDMDVNQVAAELNFADASYFVRWFRKQSDQTPEEFRKAI